MKRKCFAKINLSLDSLYQRADGYHEIDTIMARISLCDELTVVRNSTGKFNFSSFDKDLGDIENNLIYKVWDLMKDMTASPGVDVFLEKNIPIAAGLAGGSTDAAEMIKALNILWDLALTDREMMELGSKLGADIPFFFTESTARARGIGEIIDPFINQLDMKILLVNDGTESSTVKVYKLLEDYGHIDNDLIVEKLESGDPSAICHFENVMEDVVLDLHPHLLDIKKDFMDQGADLALISGSGASVFGVFPDDESLDYAYEQMKDSYSFVEKVEII